MMCNKTDITGEQSTLTQNKDLPDLYVKDRLSYKNQSVDVV
jgi:hypothetical protein